MLLVLATFLAVGVPTEHKNPNTGRPALTQPLDEADKIIAEFKRRLVNDTLVEPQPQIGIVVYSAEQVNEDDRLHSALVSAVYTGGPADRAGIRPGDRILFIGQRRLEHETTRVIYALLTQAPSPTQLTIQRGSGTPFTVSVERTSLACIVRGAHAIDKALFLSRAGDLSLVSRQMHILLEKNKDEPSAPATAERFTEELKQMLFRITVDTLSALHQSVAVSCGAKFDTE